uniref:Uncharacterized protein n=1 Tax=Anguilla anguilla TaxID=7936 RepID=A0A0E9R0G4_ANGAN
MRGVTIPGLAATARPMKLRGPQHTAKRTNTANMVTKFRTSCGVSLGRASGFTLRFTWMTRTQIRR